MCGLLLLVAHQVTGFHVVEPPVRPRLRLACTLEKLERHAKSGAWQEALDALKKAETKKETLPIEAYNMALTACFAEWAPACRILRSLTAGAPFEAGKKPKPDATTFAVAGRIASKAGRWLEAAQIVEMARRQGQASLALYTSAIAACGKARQLELALKLFRKLADERRPDTRAYTSAIDACAVVGDLSNATWLFGKMTAAGVAPNSRTYRAMAAAAARAGDFDRAAGFARECPEPPCVQAALQAARDLDEARSLFALLRLERSDDYESAYRSLVKVLRFCGPNEAGELVRTFEEHLKGSPTAWRCLRDRRAAHTEWIVACGRSGDAVAALDVLNLMKSRRISPDVTTYNAAIAACRKAKDPDKALFVFEELLAHPRHAPDAVSVAETIATLDRAGRPVDADRVLELALKADIPLKKMDASLDVEGEVDVSSLAVPVAKAVVRRTLRTRTTPNLVFITGVGKAKSPSLRDILVDLLAELGYHPVIPIDAPGTVRLNGLVC